MLYRQPAKFLFHQSALYYLELISNPLYLSTIGRYLVAIILLMIRDTEQTNYVASENS